MRFGVAVNITLHQPHAGDMAVTHDQIAEKRMFEHADARVVTHHGAHIHFEHLTGGVSPGVHHAGTAVRGFEPTQHRPIIATVHMPPGGDEFAHAACALVGEHIHGCPIAQTMTGRHGVGGVQLRVVVAEDGACHTALGVVGVGFHEFVLAYEQHVVGRFAVQSGNLRTPVGGESLRPHAPIPRCGERRGQSGDAGSDHDDHGCTSSMRCRAILASRAVFSSTVMRLTILPCSMFSSAQAR